MEGGFSRQRLLSGVVLTVVALLVLGRGGVDDGAVQAGGVEPVDPAEGGELEVVDSAERGVVADAFGLLEPDHRLRHRVIVRIAHGPHQRHRPTSASRSA